MRNALLILASKVESFHDIVQDIYTNGLSYLRLSHLAGTKVVGHLSSIDPPKSLKLQRSCISLVQSLMKAQRYRIRLSMYS